MCIYLYSHKPCYLLEVFQDVLSSGNNVQECHDIEDRVLRNGDTRRSRAKGVMMVAGREKTRNKESSKRTSRNTPFSVKKTSSARSSNQAVIFEWRIRAHEMTPQKRQQPPSFPFSETRKHIPHLEEPVSTPREQHPHKNPEEDLCPPHSWPVTGKRGRKMGARWCPV